MSEMGGPVLVDHVDSYLDMVVRRQINDFATQPVDFNTEGLRLAQQYTSLDIEDTVLDVGCSSGEFIINAAANTQTSAHLVGIDPYRDAYRENLPGEIDASRFTFLQAVGEAIPLRDNAVKVTTAHNVLFRAANAHRMLDEMKRVTEPNGLILLSTNAEDHAVARHHFERIVAVAVSQELGRPASSLPPPAHGYYMEDIPRILEESGGLEIIDTVVQRSPVPITRGERLDLYLYSLKLSANRIGGHPAVRHVWRKLVDQMVVPQIEASLQRNEVQSQQNGNGGEAYFSDTAHRGLFVLRNIKT